VSSQEADKRYEAVLKHYTRGVLGMSFFDDYGKASNWLIGQWRELHVEDVNDRQINYAGAIYGNHDGHKRLFLLGAAYLV